MIWMLTIILVAGFGEDKTPAVMTGENGYVTEDECKDVGRNLASWLSQDGVEVWFKCDPVLHTAEVK